MLKVYVKICVLIIGIGAWYGLLCPFLVSQKDDFAVVLGFVAVLFGLFPIVLLLKSIIKSIKNLKILKKGEEK